MSKRDRRERRALLALFLILAATVLAAAFGFLEKAQRGPGPEPYEGYEATAQQEPYNGWRDTFAQWAMVFLAMGGTGVSIWAVLKVGDTLRATRKGNRINRKIGKAQVRAYVSCPGANFRIGPKAAFITVQIKNTGQSPALECSLKVRQVVPNMDSVGNDDQIKVGPDFVTSVYYIPAGGVETAAITINMGWLDRKHAHMVSSGDLIFSMFCDATWVDVFKKRQELNFLLTESFTGTKDGARVGEMTATNRKGEGQ